MKKINFLLSATLMIVTTFSFAQTTETFETEPVASTSFTDNGVIFNIISHSSTFDIFNLANGGWNGTAIDARFIDNAGTIAPGASFSIKTTSNLFKANRFWIYAGNQFTNPNATGTLTITGKLSGITKFSQTKTTGFTTSTGVTNGFTLIDLTNLNGQNYSNIIIDQLQITAGGDYQYLALDAFTWVKDSGIVLATDDLQANKSDFMFYPNPVKSIANFSEEVSNIKITDLTGKTVKQTSASAKSVDVTTLEKGTYIITASTKAGHTITKKLVKE